MDIDVKYKQYDFDVFCNTFFLMRIMSFFFLSVF